MQIFAGEKEKKMSTEIHNGTIFDDIYSLESIPNRLREQADKLEKEIKEGIVEIEIDVCGITIVLDYREKEKAVIV